MVAQGEWDDEEEGKSRDARLVIWANTVSRIPNFAAKSKAADTWISLRTAMAVPSDLDDGRASHPFDAIEWTAELQIADKFGLVHERKISRHSSCVKMGV
jgi:hypothetical protein